MARIRTIKPDFFTSEDVVALSPLARLLYIATWLEADREGRFVWRPKTLKLRYLPGDDCDIDALSSELIGAGLICPYEIDGKLYADIPSFARHQVINNRESASTIPARAIDAIGTREARVNDETPTPLAGKEGKGKEGTRARRVACDGVDADFASFWQQYPNKKAKAGAQKAWEKIRPEGEVLTALMAALERQKASEEWRKEGGRYIPYPASWLNGRRWEDEISGQAGGQSIGTGPQPGDVRTRHGRCERFDDTLGWIPA